MEQRANTRRRRENRTVFVGLGVAVLLHVAAFAFVGWNRTGPEWSLDRSSVTLEPASWTGTPVDVFFGPPRIYRPDRTLAHEPDDRVLEAARLLGMPPTCLSRDIPPAAPGSGEVRLIVNEDGRIDHVAMTRSTGDTCWDAVAVRVAGQLWYRWLPSDEFPAPVEVLQPITVGLAQDQG